MNLIISETRSDDLRLAKEGNLFLGAANTKNGEVHVFLKAGHALAKLPDPSAQNPSRAESEYVTIRIVGSLSGTSFPYGTLSDENRRFIAESVGMEFRAIRNNMNYYRLPNDMLVHVYNAFELPAKHDTD